MEQFIERKDISLLSKFQGCLVGAVAGDCLGAVYELSWLHSISIDQITELVNKVEAAAHHVENDEEGELEAKGFQTEWKYTGDTAMARCIAEVLIKNKGLDITQLAKSFAEEYFNSPSRGYANGVKIVFSKLKDTHCRDPFLPAKQQYGGQGSYGNGGAMRICPAALFAFKQNDTVKLRKLVEDITKVTHTHYQAIQGAVLQAYAVDLALRLNGKPDVDSYLDSLIDLMNPLEDETNSKKSAKGEELPQFPYCRKLEKVREFVKRETPTTAEEINTELGTEISALESVPAVIFAFLYSTRDIPGLEERNPVEKAIMYAISFGGDTDTIATMTGAIAGACYGFENIPDSWLKCFEGAQDAQMLAYNLHALQKCDNGDAVSY